MNACFPEAIFRRLANADLGDSTFREYEAHIQACDPCQQHLQNLLTQGQNDAGTALMDEAELVSLPEINGFEVEAKLGEGGMGIVYLAWQTEMARYVALKLVSEGPFPDASARKRWLNEARSHSRVVHPHVVQIHDVSESPFGLFLVLEYVSGGSLKDRLAGESIPPRVAAVMMEKLARAVHELHQRGLWHLDLKPSNILLAGKPGASWEEITPKISDFGISWIDGQSVGTLTKLAGPRGTPPYMAPEQVLSRPETLGSWTDVYGLGAMLYQLLCGRPPFRAESTVELLDLIREEAPVRPRRINSRIPRDLETICLKCLEKDPERRYVSAEAFADDLRRWRDNLPIKARPVSLLGHTRAWCRRYPVVASLLATLGLTIIASFLILIGLLRDLQTRHQIASDAMSDFANFASREGQPGASATKDPVDYMLTRLRIHQRRLYDTRPHDRLERDRLVDINLSLACRLRDTRACDDAVEVLAECEKILEKPLIEEFSDTTRSFGLAQTYLIMGHIKKLRRQLNESIHFYRAAIRELRSIIPSESLPGYYRCLFECYNSLACTLSDLGEWSEARSLFKDSARLIESLPEPDASDPLIIGCRALAHLGLGDLDKALEILKQDHGESGLKPLFAQVPKLAGAILAAADRMTPGDDQTSRRRGALNLIRSGIDSTEAAVYEDPGNGSSNVNIHCEFYLALAKALTDLGRRDEAIAELRHFVSVQKIVNARRRLDSSLIGSMASPVAMLARLIAERDNKTSSPPRLSDRWVLAKSLLLEIDPTFSATSVLGWAFILAEYGKASDYRREKRFDEAQSLVAEFDSLADELVRQYPKDAFAHLAKCESQVQVAKNFWKTAGPREIKGAWHQALEAARRALELDPKNTWAQGQVIELTRRHDALKLSP